jgi:hypothetical protein
MEPYRSVFMRNQIFYLATRVECLSKPGTFLKSLVSRLTDIATKPENHFYTELSQFYCELDALDGSLFWLLVFHQFPPTSDSEWVQQTGICYFVKNSLYLLMNEPLHISPASRAKLRRVFKRTVKKDAFQMFMVPNLRLFSSKSRKTTNS